MAERAVSTSLQLSNFDFTSIALALIDVPLVQWNGVRVLVPVVLCELVRIEPESLSELGEVERLELQHGRVCSE